MNEVLRQENKFLINFRQFIELKSKLSEIMIPPLMSSTLNAESILGTKEQSNNSNPQKTTEGSSSQKSSSSGEAGRPEKSDSEKSEKTIKNKESMS